MAERVYFEVLRGDDGLCGAIVRYALLFRLREIADRAGLVLDAFGLGDHDVRLVVDGDAGEIGNLLRGLKVGTTRACLGVGVDVAWGPTCRERTESLDHAVAWAHRAPVDCGATSPLASPWSSHRDLLGYRRADFFDASAIVGRVDRRLVHELAGGGHDLPAGWPPRGPRLESLELLLRVAGGVLGVLPSDRRCFRLFVHLAKARGWMTVDVARALAVTTRRVRQLAAAYEPDLPMAMITLADPRLCRVP